MVLLTSHFKDISATENDAQTEGESLYCRAVAADAARFACDNDQTRIDNLHIPLLGRAGDFQTAAFLGGDRPLLLYKLRHAVFQ